MTDERTAKALAEGWYRAATAPGTELRVTLTRSTGGWLANATASPAPNAVLPLLRITDNGLVQVCGPNRY